MAGLAAASSTVTGSSTAWIQLSGSQVDITETESLGAWAPGAICEKKILTWSSLEDSLV